MSEDMVVGETGQCYKGARTIAWRHHASGVCPADCHPERGLIQNGNTLFSAEFNEQERKFIGQDFYLAHATDANIEDTRGDINIFSRK